MTYFLGIDLGTTYTAAAAHREDRVEVIWLGERAAVIPSVVFVKDDGTILTGETANRQALAEPERGAREFKRRFGDPTPVLVGGQPFSADLLTAHVLRDVMAWTTEREGSQPAGLCLTHPANWGPYKLDLLQQAVDQAGVGHLQVTYLAEPQAAAIHYATQERVEPGAVVAVYDLGGGTFDAALVRRVGGSAGPGPADEAAGGHVGGFEIIGWPQGVERLGGIDFDTAVMAHVDGALDGAISRLVPQDEETAASLARLRAECTDAKEVLSSDTETTIPVSLPGLTRHSVRLTRDELEAMIWGPIGESVEAMRRALGSAQVTPEQLQAVLLVGGSSRIPYVGQVISAELGRPVAVDAHPKHSVAMGAALAAAQVAGGSPEGITVVTTDEDENPARLAAAPAMGPASLPGGMSAAAIAAVADAPAGGGPDAATLRPGDDMSEGQLVSKTGASGGSPQRVLLSVLAAVVVLVGLVFLATRGGGGGDDDEGDQIAAADTTLPPESLLEEPSGTDPDVAPVSESEPQTFSVDKTVWWAGFEIAVGEATFTPNVSGWDVEIELALKNEYPENNTLGGDVSLTMGELATAEGFYTGQPQVPGEGSNQDTVTFSVGDESGTADAPPELDIDEVVLTFGGTGTNQAVVPLGEGEVETFVFTRFSVDQTLATTGDAVEFTFSEGFIDASYWPGEEGVYHVWLNMDLEYLGDFAGGHYTDPTMFSLETPSGESIAGAPTGTTGVREFVAEALGTGQPVRNLLLSFTIESADPGTYTIRYDQGGDGVVTGEIAVEVDDVGVS